MGTRATRKPNSRKTYRPDADFSSEVWKPVPGFHDLIASTMGRVAHVVGHTNVNGYVNVYAEGQIPGLPATHLGPKRGYRVGLHQVIARTFLGEPRPEQLHVNHKNGDPSDNSIENLEWCTPSENMKHAYAMGFRRKASPSKLKPKDREKVRSLYAEGGHTWRSLATQFGVSYSTIGQAIREVRDGDYK